MNDQEVTELRERLAASEKARKEADAYAGRANARIADLGERLDATEAVLRDAEKARKAWTETARMHAKNEAYYRDLIVRTLSGTPAAFVSDDGSVQQDVICAKLPELFAASEKAREEAERERDEARRVRDETFDKLEDFTKALRRPR